MDGGPGYGAGRRRRSRHHRGPQPGVPRDRALGGRRPSGRRGVAGALLVAPPDVEQPGTPEELRGFAPIPRSRLPFPSIVAASSDDPWIDEARARELATAWGARFESLGAAGHVNTAAGFGSFPRGEVLLEGLVATAAARSQPQGSAGKLRGKDVDLFDARRFGE